MSDRETEETGLLAEIAEQGAFDACFPPEAFDAVVAALDSSPENRTQKEFNNRDAEVRRQAD